METEGQKIEANGNKQKKEIHHTTFAERNLFANFAAALHVAML
ncbi:MAG: hypothetical protein SOZ80_01075 [Prevotella sp.]|nr:hypothetical protein [Prevotella sp.]MDD7318685.1 hypothetical protein [Prevotellaceae bacterium]MDY4019359.1 hypothetical protein [Prevotella sp.]